MTGPARPPVTQVRVRYEDVDMGGIVYYANYLRYIERARSDWVRGLGIDQMALREAGLVFAVRRVEADYVAPARFDDLLDVTCAPIAATPARAVLAQEVRRSDEILFRARVTVVAMSPEGRPLRLPADIRHGSKSCEP